MQTTHNTGLPNFSKIDPKEIEPTLDQILTENRAQIAKLLANLTEPTWENLIQPLDDLGDRLSHFWSPISHLHAVKQSPELREAYHKAIPKLSAYSSEIGQNEQLFQAFKKLADGSQYPQFDFAQKKLIREELKDFHLAGVDLPEQDKKRYREIKERLSTLTTKFEEHVLAATQSFSKHVTDKKDLQGLPEHVIHAAEEAAKEKNLSGYLLTLDYPCYLPVMTYADNRELRAEMYKAHTIRASEYGKPEVDNGPVMFEILQLRQELSHILGFKNYAELSLASNKMVKRPQEVLDFLTKLVNYARPQALADLNDLKQFAKERDSIEQLQPWDISYYSEKLREQRYGINDEMLRPYFPAQRVLDGLFTLINRLYGMRVEEEKNIDVWHPDVKFYSIYDHNNQLRGQFYLDLYARANKREGAWMDDCQQRRKLSNGNIQTPIAYLTCNLTPPSKDKPALLTHDEVLTIFHEFGHGLQHMLTQIDYAGVSGISGVEWDAVELPSQFNEFFVWEKSVLDFVSGHYQTGEPIPDDMIKQMHAAKNFHSGLFLARQLEFALFDFRLHLEFDAKKSYEQIQAILNEVRAQTTVVPIAEFNRFQHSFSHIFAGGYAAGYYSYLWAEVMSADAFSKFEEEGIFNPQTGQAFLQTVLELGGSKDALDVFKEFRGRAPEIAAFLKHWGIAA